MELLLENNLSNSLEQKQNGFLKNILGKAINNGINIGIRYLLPNVVEDKVIELKDNLIKFGLKDGISKTVQSIIETGKSAIGIFTGNFENVNQINEAVKNGGVLDSVSELVDNIFNKLKTSGKIDNATFKVISNGKNAILNNVEKNISVTLTNQIKSTELLGKYISNWKQYYSNQNFYGMEKEYSKIKSELNKLVPIENTINNARNIEMIHNLIKNNGQKFDLTQTEQELVEKFSLI